MARMLKYYNGDLVEYEILSLVDYYDDILRTATVPWDFNTRKEKEAEFIAFSLIETMEKLRGLGLSANQVGLRDRVCVINAGQEAWIMFNPQIISKSEIPSTFAEGCLSYPGLFLNVPRSNQIKIQFNAIGGQLVEREVEGLTAVCIQHELDHLDGIRYTDRVSPLKLEQAKRKVKKTLKRMYNITQESLKK
jgi:peptide deformylase